MSGESRAIANLAAHAEGFRGEHFAEKVDELGLDRGTLTECAPADSLRLFYRLYGFNRAGGQRAGYPLFAVRALDSVDVLVPDALWEAFVSECNREGVGVNERVNRGVVTGGARLARDRGNLFQWAGDVAVAEGLDAAYDEVRDIKGVGEKISRFFLRDAVWLSGVEDAVADKNAHLLQPVDVWVQRTAEVLWPDLDADGVGSVTVSKRVARECRRAGVSGVAFNQGTWNFCAREVDGDEDAALAAVREWRQSATHG